MVTRTEFGKYLCGFRIDKGIKLKDMADALNITPAYLSAIETGKREPTHSLLSKILNVYDFEKDMADKLKTAFDRTRNVIAINTTELNKVQLDFAFLFARKITTLSEAQVDEIMRVLESEERCDA